MVRQTQLKEKNILKNIWLNIISTVTLSFPLFTKLTCHDKNFSSEDIETDNQEIDDLAGYICKTD